jgi:hypothetical protein
MSMPSEQKEIAATSDKSLPSYGSIEKSLKSKAFAPTERPRAGRAPPSKQDAIPVASDSLEWVALGSSWTLMLTAAKEILREVAALGLIIFSVFTSHDYLMSCDTRQGTGVNCVLGTACEYTKAYVRCFPLLALTLAMMVAARQFMQHRMYYQLLRHGAILDLQNFNPLSDPLFLIMLWSAVNAIAHFVINLWHAHNLSKNHIHKLLDEQFFTEATQVAVFYIMPAIFFVLYLFYAYDTEAFLLPLNKYVEADPEYARKAIDKMPFLQEDACAAAVAELCPIGLPSLLPEDQEEAAYQLLIERAHAKALEAETNPAVVPPLSRLRLVSTMWPAQFLLHFSFKDDDSRSFRRAWYMFSAVVLAVMAGVFYYFVQTCIVKIKDVHEGQWVDLAGVIVSFLHCAMVIWLAVGVLKNVVLPLRTPPADLKDTIDNVRKAA